MSHRRKMKLNTASLSLNPSLYPERAAHAMAIVGKALMEAAAVLQGKPFAALNSFTRQNLLPGPDPNGLTVVELVNEFMLAKARAGRSDRYLRQLRVVFLNFKSGRGRAPIDTVSAQELERWIGSQNWSARTARNYLSDVRTMFNFAVKRGYLPRNPAAGVELPVLDGKSPIHIHTPEQTRTVLDKLRRANLDVCRRVAIRYFAGLRSSEANRIRECDLKLDQDLIEVTAANSKTRSRRLVAIQPNLRAWLDLGGELRGMGDRTVLEMIRLTKVPWEHNVTRHSFVSYHLAQFGNAGRTALESGHSEAMLFKHYRALVTPSVAAQYWQIVP